MQLPLFDETHFNGKRVVLGLAIVAATAGLFVLRTAREGAPIAAQPAPSPTATSTPYLPEPTATPTVTSGEGQCTIQGRQSAAPQRVERWQPLRLSVSLTADCPAEARARTDIFLLIDGSSSMGEGGKHEAARAAVEQFLVEIDFTRHRVGLIAFSDTPWVAQPLTDRSDRLSSALSETGQPSGGTNIGAAIRMAQREIDQTGRRGAVGVVVLLTDGRQSSEDAMLQAAADARAAGIVLFAIGLGVDAARESLRRLTDDPERYYDAPTKDDLAAIYEQIASLIREMQVTDLQLIELPAPGVEQLPGTGVPNDPIPRGALLTQRRTFLAAEPVTWTRQVRIARTGSLTPSADLWIEFADGDGTRRRQRVDRAIVEVYAPTIRHIHLPFTVNNWCFPATRHADVALVLDASNSMTGDKLAQAVAGAEAFVELLQLAPRGDRAAVVNYDASARLAQPLTRDAAALRRALRGITVGSGTRIDAGLRVGLDALTGDRGDDNRKVIVLLTDGQQREARAEIYAAVARAKAQGVILHAVALGDNADRALLESVAQPPGRLWVARTAADLVAIYRSVAGAVGCR